MKAVYLYDLGLIPVLFPQYKETKDSYVPAYHYSLAGGILVGDPTALQIKRFLDRDASVSIPDRWSAYEFVCENKKKKVKKSLIKHIERVKDEMFLRELLLFSATGDWTKTEPPSTKMYELFSGLTESKSHFLRIYFGIRESYSYGEVWSAVLTFFQRVQEFDSQDESLSEFYRKVLLKYKAKQAHIKAIEGLFYGNHVDEMVVLNYLLGIR